MIDRKRGNLDKINTAIGFSAAFIAMALVSFILELNLIVPLILILFALYLKITRENLVFKENKILGLVLLFVILFVSARLIASYPTVSAFLVPVPAFAMLITILFNDVGLAFVMSVAASLVVGVVVNWDFRLALVLMVGGISASLLVKDARRRSEITRAGFLVGVIQSLAYLSLFGLESLRKRGGIYVESLSCFLLPHCFPNFLNGLVSAILAAGSLPIFEYLLGVVTNISLLELSDFNHPLLRRMILEAPGTYHHSLVVGNLAEAAAEAIGANSLLTRAGSYYHDIGKLEKAEYFTENQCTASKHEQLKPSISKLVIMNHVKEGLEVAKRYRLNRRIHDFILQHHGTSLVFYFYRRALEEAQEQNEEEFRYPGPRPQSRETAIVLLADSVEAASRTLNEPSAQRIQELVRKVINNKFIDGQLDECELTLKDLEKIASVFTHILTGIYHGRIEYPQDKDSDTGFFPADSYSTESPTDSLS